MRRQRRRAIGALPQLAKFKKIRLRRGQGLALMQATCTLSAITALCRRVRTRRRVSVGDRRRVCQPVRIGRGKPPRPSA